MSEYREQFEDYCKDKVRKLGSMKCHFSYDKDIEIDEDDFDNYQIIMQGDIRDCGKVNVVMLKEDADDSFICADIESGEIVIETSMITPVEYAARMEFSAIDEGFYNDILKYWEDMDMDLLIEDNLH